MRRLLIIGAGTLVLALLALLLLLIAPGPVQSIRTALLQVGVSAVSGSLNGSLEVGDLRGSLLRNPSLHDFVVRDADGVAVIQLEELRLSYGLSALLRKRLLIHDITLVRPQVTLSQDDEGNLNLSQLAPPSASPPEPEPVSTGSGLPIEIELSAFQIQEGHLDLQLNALSGVRTVDNLNAKLGALLTSDVLQFEIQHFQAQTRPANVNLQDLHGLVRKVGTTINIDDLRVKTEATHIAISGVLPSPSQPASLTATIDPFDIAEIGRLLDDPTLKGQVFLTLKAEGPPENIHLTSQLRAEGGTLDFDGQLDIASTQPAYQGQLELSQLNFSALAQRESLQSDLNVQASLKGSGVSLEDLQADISLNVLPSTFGNITLRPSHIQLTAANKRFAIQQFNLDTSVAQMEANGVLDLAGQSDLTYHLQAKLDDLKSLLNTQALNGNLDLQGTAQGEWPALTTQGTLDASNLKHQTNTLQSVTLTYEASQLGTQPLATANLQLKQAQFGTFPVAQVELQAQYDGPQRRLQVNTHVNQSDDYEATLSGRVDLTTTGQDIQLNTFTMRLNDHQWQASEPIIVALQGSDVQIQSFHLVHDDESIELSGGLIGDQFKDLKVNATQINLDFLRRLLTLPELVTGRATLGTHIAGSFSSPTLQTDLEILTDKEANNPFDRLHATLNYAKKHLTSDIFLRQNAKDTIALNLNVPIDMALTDLTLAQRLQAKPVAIRLDIAQPDLAAIGRGLPSPVDLSGTVEGAIDLSGPYSNLSLDTNLSLQDLGLAGAIEHLNAPLQLTGTLIAGDSVATLAEMLASNTLVATLRDLTLRSEKIEGILSGQEKPNDVLRLKDLLLQAHGRWTPDGLSATLQTLQLQAKALDLPPTTLAVTGQMTPELIELSKLQLKMPKSEINGNGQLTVANQALDFKLEFPQLQLSEVVPTLPTTLPSELTGNIAIRGRVPEPIVEAHLQYGGAQIDTDISANLQEAVPEYEADLSINGLDVSQFTPDLSGRLTTRLSLEGKGVTEQDRQARLKVDVTSDAFSLAPQLAAVIRGSVEGAAVDLSTFTVQSDPINLTAKGSISDAKVASFTYDLALDDLTSIREQLGIDVDAKGTLTGRLTGPLDNLTTQANLKLDQWKYTTFQGEGLTVDVDGSGLPATPQANVTARLTNVQGPSLPSSNLSLDGRYQVDQGDFNLTVTDGPFKQTQLAGKANLNAGQEIVLDTLRIQRGDWAWATPQPVAITRSTAGLLEIPNFVLRNGEEELLAQVRLSPNGKIDGKIKIDQLQILRNVRALAPSVIPPDGLVRVDMTIGGTVERPSATGTAQLQTLKWQGNDLGDVNAKIDLANNVLNSDVQWQHQQTELLRANGTMGLDADGKLDMKIKASDFDFARLKTYTPAVTQSAGLLNLDFSVAGTLKQPDLTGDLTLRDGSLQLVATGEPYTGINTQIRMANERLTIDQLQVGSSTGTLQLSGWAQLAELALQELDVKVNAQDFKAMNTSDIQATLTTDITAQGTLEDLSVNGKIIIPQARIRAEGLLGGAPPAVKPEELTVEGVYGQGVKVAEEKDDQPDTEPKKDPLPFLRANVKLDMPKNIWVQARGTAIELRGDLLVKKELQSPLLITGDIETVRGFASFFGKKFNLQSGQVSFTGAEEINPTLDVTATHKVAGYIVTIQVEGPSTKPKLNLSSSPEALEQADIMSLLLFGKTSDRLSSSEETSLSGRAKNAAAGAAAGAAAQAVGKELGLDTVEVELGDDPSQARVGAGRYITQDIFLTYERQLGQEGGNTVGVEYSLTRRLMLKGARSDIGESSLDVLWRIDY